MYKLRLHISQSYKSECYSHRLTKKGLLISIFTSHKMNQRQIINSTTFFSKCGSSTTSISIFGIALAELGSVFFSVSLLHPSFRTLLEIFLGICWIEINICRIVMIDKRKRKGKGCINKFIKELKRYLNLFLLQFSPKKNIQLHWVSF